MTEPRSLLPVVAGEIEIPRTARYYEIQPEAGRVEEIWFVLHGFGQLAAEFITYFGDLASGPRLIVAPEALNRYYLASTSVPAAERAVGATWMTREDRQNEMKDYVRYLDLLHARIVALHPGARTVVVGFSQGGATGSRWAASGHASIDRLVLWGATAPPDLPLAPGVFRGAKVTLVAGRRDHYVTAGVLAAERSRLDAAGIPHDVIEFDGGHSVKRTVFPQLTG